MLQIRMPKTVPLVVGGILIISVSSISIACATNKDNSKTSTSQSRNSELTDSTSRQAPNTPPSTVAVSKSDRLSEFSPRTFNEVPSNPRTPEEFIAAIYLLTKDGRVEDAIALAPDEDQNAWRSHLVWHINDLQKRNPSVPEFAQLGIRITEIYSRGEGEYLFNTDISDTSGVSICVQLDGNTVVKLIPC